MTLVVLITTWLRTSATAPFWSRDAHADHPSPSCNKATTWVGADNCAVMRRARDRRIAGVVDLMKSRSNGYTDQRAALANSRSAPARVMPLRRNLISRHRAGRKEDTRGDVGRPTSAWSWNKNGSGLTKCGQWSRLFTFMSAH